MALAFGPGLVSYLLVTYSGWSGPALALIVAVLIAIAGFGFYVVGTIAHEGFHFTLARDKWTSALIGTWFSAAVFAFFGLGFYLVHARHHRYTNAPNDPDYQLFSQFTTTWKRLVVLRLVNNRVYVKIVARLLLKNELPEGTVTVFTYAQLKSLAAVNVIAQVFWAGLYVFAFCHDVWLGVFLVLLPHVATAAISAAIVFVQHADTGDQLHDNARTHATPLMTLLMAGTNYHLEHHLYPRVPCWRLRRVHAWLGRTAWASENSPLIERRFWRGLMLFRAQHPYGRRS
jgi:fatty acid desaturase